MDIFKYATLFLTVLFSAGIFVFSKEKNEEMKNKSAIATTIFFCISGVLFIADFQSDPRLDDINLNEQSFVLNQSDIIEPKKVTFEGDKATLWFDWTIDNALSPTNTFNGTGISISMYQNSKQLNDKHEDMLEDLSSDIYDKNSIGDPKAMKFDYYLNDRESNIEIRIDSLEDDVISIDVPLK